MQPSRDHRDDAHVPVDTDRKVLGREDLALDNITPAKRPQRLPTVFNRGEVYLPYALARKHPNAARRWGWQYLFPARSTAVDPRSAKTRRRHLGETAIQKAVKKAMSAARIHKHGSCHTLRHSLPLIFWRTATTSERCGNCSVTKMSGPP